MWTPIFCKLVQYWLILLWLTNWARREVNGASHLFEREWQSTVDTCLSMFRRICYRPIIKAIDTFRNCTFTMSQYRILTVTYTSRALSRHFYPKRRSSRSTFVSRRWNNTSLSVQLGCPLRCHNREAVIVERSPELGCVVRPMLGCRRGQFHWPPCWPALSS